MCGLCGAFGVQADWSEAAGGPGTGPRRRQHRARIANRVLRVFGLKLDTWGERYILRGRTGRSGIVDNLTRMWPVAEQLAGRTLDPLDERLLAELEGR
jgi:hypothetical protein